MGDDVNSHRLNDNLKDRSRAITGASTANTSPQEQPRNLDMQGLLSQFTNHYEDGEDKNIEEAESAAASPAPSAFTAASSSLSPVPDGDDHAAHKICTRPRCPHNKIRLNLVKFQEMNKRGEVITWKHCKDCRTKHAKEDRERKQAIRVKTRTRAHDDKEDDSEAEKDKKNRLTKLVTLHAPSSALRTLATGGNIAGELTENCTNGSILVFRDGSRDSGQRRRQSLAVRKRPKKEDRSSDGDWGLQQVQKRRKSVHKGSSGKARKDSRVGKRKPFEGELGPEDSVYDTGTNSEEERDKKSGERGARRK